MLTVPGFPTPTPALPKIANVGAVIYIDGGTRPNPGNCGLGFHGYIYSLDEPKKGNGFKKGVLTKTGYGAKLPADEKPITILNYIDGYGYIKEEASNNVAELRCAIRVVRYIKELLINHPIGKVVLRPDSEYVKEGITSHVFKWMENGWITSTNGPVKNIPLWKELISLVNEVNAAGVELEWIHVAAHQGEHGNEIADYYATMGVNAVKHHFLFNSYRRPENDYENIKLSDAQGYHTQIYEPNRLLSFNRLYFNTGVGGTSVANDGRYVYYTGKNTVETEQEGKPQGDTRYSVALLKDRDPIIEDLFNHQDNFCNDKGQFLAIARLDNIFSTRHCPVIERFGAGQFTTKPNGMSMFMPYDPPVEITEVLRTPRMALNAVNALIMMQYILEDAIAGRDNITVTDITSILYEVDTTKKIPVTKLKKQFDAGTKSFTTDVNYKTSGSQGVYPVDLSIDIDLPDRNTLSAIAELKPIVKVVSWEESAIGFRYAVWIEMQGDSAIYAAVHSNLRVLQASQ